MILIKEMCMCMASVWAVEFRWSSEDLARTMKEWNMLNILQVKGLYSWLEKPARRSAHGFRVIDSILESVAARDSVNTEWAVS